MEAMLKRYEEPVEDPLQVWSEKGEVKVLLNGI